MLASFNQTLPSRIRFMFCNRSMGAEYHTTHLRRRNVGCEKRKIISANAFTLDQWECTLHRFSTSVDFYSWPKHSDSVHTHTLPHPLGCLLRTMRRMTRQFVFSILIDLISQHLLIDWQMLPKFDLCVYYMCCVSKKNCIPNASEKKIHKVKNGIVLRFIF